MVASYDEKYATGQDTSDFIDIEGVEIPQEPTASEELESLIK